MLENNRPKINGFLIINKPKGLTSMDVVRQVKRLTGQRKRVGHGGTLDPLAEGVLPICFGQATRLMEYLVNDAKDYRLEVCLGATSNTLDAEGIITDGADPSHITKEAVEEALQSFRGTVFQTPPMHSAIKMNGRRLYELARQGLEVERQPRKVEITRLSLVEFNLPNLTLEVECGRGVYMRSLADDLGQLLGCGAYVTKLVRLRSGPFHSNEAVSLKQLEASADTSQWHGLIHPLDYLLLHMKSAVVTSKDYKLVRNGQSISLSQMGLYAKYLESCRVYTTDGRFLAVVRFDKPRNRWDPYKVFHLDDPSPHAPTPDDS